MKPSLMISAALLLVPAVAPAEIRSPGQLYRHACARCHGADGKGPAQEDLAFETPVPEFSDCEFASREPDPDWYAIIHEGGPARAFDRMMPAFGDALTGDEIDAILRHVRSRPRAASTTKWACGWRWAGPGPPAAGSAVPGRR